MGVLRRLVDVLGPVGFIVIVVSLWLSREGRALPGDPQYYLIGGLALIVAHLTLRWEALTGGVGRRQWAHGTNAFVLTAAVLGILGALNYIAYRNTKRLDLTKDRRFSLSDQTRKVLAGITEEAKITYFQRGEIPSSVKDRLTEYQAASARLKVQYVDPWKSPGLAREYDVTSVPSLVLEYGGKRERFTNESEQEITNALIKVTREGTKTVCFVEGEGERNLDDAEGKGLSGAKAALEKSQYQTRKLFLMREKSVPADCAVLAIAGPKADVLAPGIDVVRDYVSRGGKLLVMLEPELEDAQPQPNLVGLLDGWNITPGRDVVVDVSGLGELYGTGPITPLVMEYTYHEITRDLQVMSAFHEARSMTAGTATKAGLTTQDLVRTSNASWAETDLTLKEPVRMDEGKDRAGPVSLAVAATIRPPEPEVETKASTEGAPPAEGEDQPAEGEDQPAAEAKTAPDEEKAADAPAKPEGRVVAVGDADFASNTLLGFPGNRDLFLNMVSWLAQDTDLISIRPKEPQDQRLILTGGQQLNLAWTSLILIPFSFVALGVLTWWRRRG
jgi:ABC-type uncharacterized transport system involved in gliding motility auxiliary subunit